MDNLTHSLTGIALARAGLDRLCPRAIWLLLVSANLPDADIIVATRGSFAYFEAHRGYSHCLVAMPIVSALSMLIVAACSRKTLPWLRAWLLCMIGVASHLALDATNSYGIRLGLPFSSRWFALDWTGLYDVWIWTALGLAVVWPLFAGLVSGEIGSAKSRGRGLAMVALGFFIVFDLARGVVHSRIVAQLQSRFYNDAIPLQTAALPNPYSPLQWTAVVETPGAYERFETQPFGQYNSAAPQIFYKPTVTTALDAARAVEPFRYFQYFARFPVWAVEPVANERTHGTRVELADLRFGSPGAGSFHCIAYVDAQDRVEQKWFTYGSGANLGWQP